jgi:homoserine kinase
MKKRVRARAYTSIGNVGHGLDVLGLCVDAACDEVEALRAAEGLTLRVSGPFREGVPSEPAQNSAGLAVQSLLEAHKVRDGVALEVHKGTRPGSGLGSSAASAAAAVLAVSELFSLGLSPAQLTRFAAEGERAAADAPHADNVAAALLGGLAIVGDPPFETVIRINSAAAPTWVLARPSIHIATRDARRILPKEIRREQYVTAASHVALTIASWQAGDIAAFGDAIEGSFVDHARATLIPGFAMVRTLARQAGAAGVIVSGGGPSIAAVLAAASRVEPVSDAMRAGFATAGLECDVFVASVGPGAAVIERE